MSLDIIDKIRNASPTKRKAIITKLYEKNRTFFAKTFPEIDNFLDHGRCPYQINITDDFLEIIHSDTKELAHPAAGLDRFSELLSDPENGLWIDLNEFMVIMPSEQYRHGQILREYNRYLMQFVPNITERIEQGYIERPHCANNRLFSPPVVFVGVFHGLHIAKYLSNHCVSSIMIIEPEPERFMVSCYLLDYEEVFRMCQRLLIVLDPKGYDNSFSEFFSWKHITAQVWTRVLPGYATHQNNSIIQRLSLTQKVHLQNIRPFDIEIDGIKNTIRNIRQKLPILTLKPCLSDNAAILIVGSGPSLENDLEWIRQNQDKFLIFAVHSAIKILKKHGIRPDFQFSIDMHLDSKTIKALDLFPDVPLVALTKANKQLYQEVKKILLVEPANKVHPVDFNILLEHIIPTTGNLAIGFAAFLKPSSLILSGMDFGFKTVEKRHAAGGFYGTGRTKRKIDAFQIPSNFDSQMIFTTSFLNRGRIEAEKALASISSVTTMWNIGDGAKIAGANPIRSTELTLPDYPQKDLDYKGIISSFKPAEKDINWRPYSQDGNALLQEFRDLIIDGLQMDHFEMAEFTCLLDSVLRDVVEQMGNKKGGERIELYLKLVLDLLAILYRYLLFSRGKEERRKIYQHGLEKFKRITENLNWPDTHEAAP